MQRGASGAPTQQTCNLSSLMVHISTHALFSSLQLPPNQPTLEHFSPKKPSLAPSASSTPTKAPVVKSNLVKRWIFSSLLLSIRTKRVSKTFVYLLSLFQTTHQDCDGNVCRRSRLFRCTLSSHRCASSFLRFFVFCVSDTRPRSDRRRGL